VTGRRGSLGRFEDIVSSNQVVLFLKGRASFPLCGLSGDACSMLKKKWIKFKEVDLLEDPELYLFMKEEYASTTAPYLFVNGKFVGGYEEIKQLFETGKLVNVVR
jgi:monothiol glutaredoxin